MRRLATALVIVAGLVLPAPLHAQDDTANQQQKDWLVQLLEGQLSTPDRQISISNIDGILSQDASIREITISDKQGVWLRVDNIVLNWNQAALFTGRLMVNSLTAESIEYLRNAVPSEDVVLPAPEAGTFSVPEFPIAIQIDKLSVPKVTFGEQVFGLGSEISVDGALKLEGGNLDTSLDINRLDGPGGTLAAKIAYLKADNTIDLGVTLTEPENGILANLLNIEGRPDIALTVAGSGPVADLRTELTLDAGGTRALSGTANIDQTADGFAVDAQLGGPISTLMAEPYRPFFGTDTSLALDMLVKSAGGIRIDGFRIDGGQLKAEGSAETTADNFLARLDVDATIADPGGVPVLLPIPGATTIKSAQLGIAYGGDSGEDWSSTLDIADLTSGDLTIGRTQLSIAGIIANLADPATRRLTFNGDGMMSAVVAADPDVQAALGDSIGFGVAGLWNAGEPTRIAELRLEGKAMQLLLAGNLNGALFDGTIGVETSSIAPFSGLAGRELEGALSLKTSGTIDALVGGFDLNLDGTGTNLRLDEPALDRLLAGTVDLSGRVARTPDGLTADNFRIANQQVQIAADGTIASGKADFTFSADLADLGLISPDAGGALNVTGTATGQDGPIAVALTAKVPVGRLLDKSLTNAAFGFNGTLIDGLVSGQTTGDAFLDGLKIDLAGNISAGAEARQIQGLVFNAGPTSITGDLSQDAAGLLDGTLVLQSSNINAAAALLLVDATGAVDATIALSHQDGTQNAQVDGNVSALHVADARIGQAEIKATIADLFGIPRIDGLISGTDIAAAGVTIRTLDARASRVGELTNFTGAASLTGGTEIELGGSLAPLQSGYRLALDSLSLQQGTLSARLVRPASLTIEGEQVTLDEVRLDVGGGTITATGSAGRTIAINARIDRLPLAIANAVAPGLGLAGTIDGTASIGGTGTAPTAQFNITGSGINANALRDVGIGPAGFAAEGTFANQVVRLTRLTANGNGGLTLTGSGTVPLEGRGLDLRLRGSAPLAIGNRFVADRGGQLSGTLNLDATITGSLASPRFAGNVSTNGAGYVDPMLNLRLVNITGSAALNSDRATINSLSANLSTGGSISASGSIGLTGDNQANVALRLNSARYADGTLFVATVSGDLSLTGPLSRGAVLGGNVLIEKADITVPDSFGGSAALIDVRHIDPPPGVAATLQRARINVASGSPVPQARTGTLRLDVNVTAPNQIFVRGRGLDAEVAGSVRLTGPVNDIQPVGSFSLVRGRLAILGQRVTFESGEVTLVGDLDPFLNFVARTQGDDITVIINVAGRATEPVITFSSNPPLPQDEVLARLIFKRGMGELSPLQLAKLAGAAAELAGGSNPSLLDALRNSTGLDDLDVVTDAQGNLALQAGRYIQDNIYLGVQAGANGDSRVTVNLDITNDLKATATTGVDGNSSVGIFYETDY